MELAGTELARASITTKTNTSETNADSQGPTIRSLSRILSSIQMIKFSSLIASPTLIVTFKKI